MAKKLYTSYGIFVPELNAAPVLWRAVKYMGGNGMLRHGSSWLKELINCGNCNVTAVLYTMAKALGRVLQVPLTLNPVMTARMKESEGREGRMHKGDNVPVEVSLVVIVVVGLKMMYGLDGQER